MKEFKGTPKPWRFDDLEFKIKGTGDIDNLTVIANVSPKMDFSRGKTTQFYNAQLIATAPELLEALQEMIELFPNENIDQQNAKVKAVLTINKALGL